MRKTLKAKPSAFARIEKLVYDQMINPLARFGAVVVSSMATEKKQFCTRNAVLESVTI
jgi:hypothetical protein